MNFGGMAISSPWLWIIAGLGLAACELVAPGVFLIWLGLAAVLTGIVVAVVGLAWQIQALVFAGFAVLAVLAGRRVMRHPISDLNRRGHSLVGREFVLETPIAAGLGRLQLGDTSWRVTGPDLPVGARIRVIALDGTTLIARAVTS